MTSATASQRHRPEQSLDDRPLILVVHGSPSVRHALLVTLDLFGFDVLVTGDSVAAVSMLTDTRPRVIIADLGDVGAGEGDLLRHLRADVETADIPVIHFGQPGAVASAWDFSVNGVHHVPREDGVTRLLEVLHDLAARSQPLDRGGPPA